MLCKICYNKTIVKFDAFSNFNNERMIRMKRLIALLLVMLLVLCGCKKAPEPTVPSTEPSTVEETQETKKPDKETTPETTKVNLPYQNPLTGEGLAKPYKGRVTTVVVDNIEECLPQRGIAEADMIYELETEGGITRLLAVFTDPTAADDLGPIRSDRSFFNNINVSYGGTVVHCGGSGAGLGGCYDDSGVKIKDWSHIDVGNYEKSHCYRDKDRIAAGYHSWDVLFTYGEKVADMLKKTGKDTVGKEETDFGLTFDEDVKLKGDKAEKITVKFRWWKTTTMTYDKKTGLYKASQYDAPHIDENTGETLSYKNVFVLYVDQWGVDDGKYVRSYYDLVGSGKGHFATGGKIVPIQWHREDLYGPFSYTLEDGTPLTLGVGTSYFGIVHHSRTAIYE